jgi:uncharacterized protein
MFELIHFVAFLLGVGLTAAGIHGVTTDGLHTFVTKKKGIILAILGILIIITTSLGLWYLDFYSEQLWFRAEGYENRFLALFWARWEIAAITALVSGGITAVIIRIAKFPLLAQIAIPLIAALTGAMMGISYGEEWMLFKASEDTGIIDPILGRDVSFYLFELPFYRLWISIGIIGSLIGTIATIALIHFGRNIKLEWMPDETLDINIRSAERAAGLGVGIIAILIAASTYLSRYNLLHSGSGLAGGPSYTEATWSMPLLTIEAAIFALAGIIILGWSVGARSFRRHYSSLLAGGLATSLIVFAIAHAIILGAVQQLRVAPNELAVEAPYIRYGMEGTRTAFKIDQVTEQRPDRVEPLSAALVSSHADVLREVPLWDYRALEKVFTQLQRVRTYYELSEPDIDRYWVDGEYRQVMISARELNQERIPEQSQTFVNLRFKYTHGYGVVVTPVNEFAESGQPTWWARDIPASAPRPEFALTRPEIYFGELTNSHVYLRSTEPEFHHPAGESNVETFYEGDAGVQLNSLLTKLAIAKRYDGMRIFTSRYLTDESRIIYRRNIIDRATAITPFFTFDEDPYVVVNEGQIFWILDGYSSTHRYPYSERFRPLNANYFRNPVKVVINAYTGQTDYYLVDETDVIAQTYSRAFPGLIKPLSEMPEGLRAHLRYPEELLTVQGLVYAKFHMEDLNVFYNQEDLWVPATEVYYGQERRLLPYYTLWRAPGEDATEFVMTWPFTPRGRYQTAGWLTGRSDGERYGELLATKLPKDNMLPGPQLFEAAIDGDPVLANQLALWNRSGSRVVRGHVITVPLGESFIHIEPIYLESERASMPRLQLVAAMHGERMSYAPTLEGAIRGLLGRDASNLAQGFLGTAGGVHTDALTFAASEEDSADESTPRTASSGIGARANEAFEQYLKLQAEGRFEEAAREMSNLRTLLQQMAQSEM